ncbi:MAG TPA: TonB-dependent receptor plug domain-containing protein, partial [Prolixibacteraceae bacterium]|nr:TonB-dependent receptor plug domain-containing protein [Prolixibacteraceae bacterium]
MNNCNVKKELNSKPTLKKILQLKEVTVIDKFKSELEYICNHKKKWGNYSREMQTCFIMNKQNLLINLKRLTAVAALFLFGATTLFAQDTLLVNGTVVNGANKPIPNVSVAVEGSFELPAVTNDDGEFQVKILSGTNWLNVEPADSYKNKRVFLNNRTDLKIYLTENDVPAGSDVINILEQNRLRRNIIASYVAIDPDNAIFTPALSIDEYLQGRTSGAHITNRSGLPGSGAVTLIRGVKSLNTSNSPLYVVDGIPLVSQGVFRSSLDGFEYNGLLSVNPMDISRVTVVKDPVISTAYGSKASNGLVLIRTLDPSATQTIIELDIRGGYSLAPSNNIPQLNARQHKTLISEVLVSSGMQEEDVVEEYPNLFLETDEDRYIDYQHDTDWQRMIFSDATLKNININVKGGDEIARYGLSFGYTNADGIIKTTGYDGYNLRFVSLLNIFTWLKMNAGVSLNYSNSQLKESARIQQTNPILASLGKSPLLNPFQYDDEGRELIALAPVDELGVS